MAVFIYIYNTTIDLFSATLNLIFIPKQIYLGTKLAYHYNSDESTKRSIVDSINQTANLGEEFYERWSFSS